MFERIFFRSQNLERDRYMIYCHLIEKAGGFAKAVFQKRDYPQAERYLAKMFAWYCALLRALGPLDVEERVWEKFPKCCPYCLHDECVCSSFPERPEPHPELVRNTADRRFVERPRDLVHWQQMFDRIYNQSGSRSRGGRAPAQPTPGEARRLLERAFNRTVEELGEVAEAMRLEEFYPDNLRNEIADVFAWLCALANLLPVAFEQMPPLYLADIVWRLYPDVCPDCGHPICLCRLEPVRAELSRAGIYADGVDIVTRVQIRNIFERDYDRLQREPPDGSTGLLLIDLDEFKRVNDRFGHPQGDAVLRAVAEVVARLLEGRGRLYRYGGDEFVAILRGVAVGEERVIAEAIDSAIAELKVPSVDEASEAAVVTASVGAAHETTCPEGREMLRAADADMYLRKRSRKEGHGAPRDDNQNNGGRE